MNTLELVTTLRTNILDDTGGTGVDWTGYTKDDFDSVQLRWGNEELVANINEAINLVYRRTTPIKSLETLDITALNSTYSIPEYVLEIIDMKLSNGKALEKASIDALWRNQSFFTDENEPRYYIPDVEENSIMLYPKPLTDDTISYLFHRLPKVPLSWSSPTLSPELKVEFHFPMLFYAAHLCYMKDEANTLDPKRAASYLQLFDNEFPALSAYASMRRSKTSNRPIAYGGIGGASYGRGRGSSSRSGY
jgi:hypothetical protein